MQESGPGIEGARASSAGPIHQIDTGVPWSLPHINLQSLFADDRFRIVPETMVDGLIVIDGTGLIQYVNRGCETLFGYSSGQLLGRNVSTLMPEPYSSAHDGFLARHRETRVKRIIGVGRELTGLKADGTIFPMYLSVGEAETASGAIFVGIIYDLTDKKRAEEMILHHQKLDAIGQLSGGIAHDFNNILAVIGGNLEMIANVDLPPAARRAVARAQEAATRAARITQRLLAFARKQPLRRESLDLNRCLADMAEMLQRSIGRAVDVRMHLASELAPVEADIDQFETAILNLCVNARDAMPDGGVITIETEAVHFDEGSRTQQDIPPGDYLRVSVSDTGTGMTPEVRARAIEPFFTTKEVGSGTGLGLSMVYGFMKQLEGHARLHSEVGRGTRVSLFFPASAQAPVTTDGVVEVVAPAGRGEVILVVEDDPDVRLVTMSRLESLGYRIRIAEDGQQALDVLNATTDVQLALVDVVMPGGMDGHALADEIDRRFPAIKIVLTSGYSPSMAEGKHMTRPLLPKPSSKAQLAQVIARTLRAKN